MTPRAHVQRVWRTRLSMLQACQYMVVGVMLPFWPAWLENQGFSPAIVATIIAMQTWARLIGNPIAGSLADRSGSPRRILMGLAVIAIFSLAACAAIPTQQAWSAALFMAVLTVFGGAFASILPLSESLSVQVSQRARLDYGRIRMWGSLAFVGMVLGTGALIQKTGDSVVLPLALGCLALTGLAAMLLPGAQRLPAHKTKALPPWRALLDVPGFVPFLLGAALMQGSHGLYYAMGTIHWRAEGLSDSFISVLWSLGVVAEIVLFLMSAAMIRRFGAHGMLLLCGLGGVIRWPILALSADPALLIPAQCLHALTFGAGHLGAMIYLGKAVPRTLAARAQSLYGIMNAGIVLGLAMVGLGAAYESLGGMAYLGAAAMSLAGMVVLMLARTKTS